MSENIILDVTEELKNNKRKSKYLLKKEEETKPFHLVRQYVETGIINPCKAIELGCGEGNCALWLANKSFSVIGIDSSKEAIKKARRNYMENLDFYNEDVTRLNDQPDNLGSKLKNFGFALDWNLLEHIPPNQTDHYLNRVAKLLDKDGKYLSVFTDIRSEENGAPGEKVRLSPSGDFLFYRPLNEITSILSDDFKIIDVGYFKKGDIRFSSPTSFVLARKK